MIRTMLLTIIITTLIACTGELDHETQRLVAAKNKWEKTGYGKKYRYAVSIGCQKPINSKLKYIVAKLGKLESDNPSNFKIPNSTNDIFTVEGQLDYVLWLIQKKEEGKMEFEVEYHEKMGYPIYVHSKRKGVIDGVSQVCFSSLEIM